MRKKNNSAIFITDFFNINHIFLFDRIYFIQITLINRINCKIGTFIIQLESYF